MHLSIDQLFSDPSFYFHSFDGENALFVHLTRDDYAQSIFFDKRIRRTLQTAFKVPLTTLMAAIDRVPAVRPVNMIHHIAQCGSTLLSRALDVSEGALAIREPSALRQLGVEVGASGPIRNETKQRLRLALRLLGKSFQPGPVVIKGNVPTVMIADSIEELQPCEAGILLYYPLEDYLAAVMRTPRHQQWVMNVTDDLRVSQIEGIGDLSALSVSERAAALWSVLIGRFQAFQAVNPKLKSLDANRFFEEPADTLLAASNLLSIPLTAEAIERRVGGPLFASYSKNPGMAYASGEREARRAETKAEHAGDLRQARAWLSERKDLLGVPERLEGPLVGPETPLL